MKSPLANALGGQGIDLRFVGYTSVGDTSLMIEPTPGERLVNQGAIERDLARKRAAQEAAAPLTPYCASLTSLVVLGEAGTEPVFVADSLSPAWSFLKWLTTTYGEALGSSIKGDPPDAPVFFLGFNIKSVFEIACKSVLMQNVSVRSPLAVPARLWHNSGSFLYDPCDLAISSSDRSVLTLDSVLAALGIDATVSQVADDPVKQAVVARMLTQRLQLFGQWTD